MDPTFLAFLDQEADAGATNVPFAYCFHYSNFPVSPPSPSSEAGPSFPARQRNKRLVSALSDEEDTPSAASLSKKSKASKGKQPVEPVGPEIYAVAAPTRRWSREDTPDCIDLTTEAVKPPSTPEKTPFPDPFSPEQPIDINPYNRARSFYF
jgi:hypothetical protein